jgi:hypothetical protein
VIVSQPVSNPFAHAEWLAVTRPASSFEETAKWIWVHEPGHRAPTSVDAESGTVRLSKDWVLSAQPVAAEIGFAVDNRCSIRVNGVAVADWDHWDALKQVDATAYLHAGHNLIEVKATNDEAAPPNPAGFLFFASADSASGRSTLVSDRSWRSSDGETVEVGPFHSDPWRLSLPPKPNPLFRRVFTLNGKVKRAVAHVIGLGHYDLFVNGKRQGDGILNQPWSQYDKTIYWKDFDVTKALQRGANVIGMSMGNGFFRVGSVPPGRYVRGADGRPDFSEGDAWKLAVSVEITYGDGSRTQVESDGRWRWKYGPYTVSNVFAGEDYDARLMPADWMEPDAPAEDWQAPRVVPAPSARLRPMDWPELRETQEWAPIAIREVSPEVWNYVFPQNASGVLDFQIRGPRGATVKFKPSEVMANGLVKQLNLSGTESVGNYTLAGNGLERHEWRFYYHGFRYVEVTGAVPKGRPNPMGLPELVSLTFHHTRTANREIGQFHTSSDLFNRIHGLVDWAIRSNMSYVMTDCPHREKAGWLECSHLLFSSFAYRYETHEWFRKIVRDIADSQLADGNVPTVAPRYLVEGKDNPFGYTVEWGAASVMVPYQAYRWYGDGALLESAYPTMRRYVDYLEAVSPKGIAPTGLGDWYDYKAGHSPGASLFTPTDLSSTAMWAMCVKAVQSSAQTLGKTEDARHYAELFGRIREAFLARFYHPATHTFENRGSCQTGNAMALCAELVPDADRPLVVQKIVDELAAHGYQQTPGDVGHLFFIRALAEAGRSDVLYKVYSRTGLGSYGGILAKGLTSLPESWDALTEGGNSLNHCMLGHVMEWFYGWVLGIRQEAGSVGWRQMVIGPEPGGLSNAYGKTETPRGEVVVAWHCFPHGFKLELRVPPGDPARVILPGHFGRVLVDGRALPRRSSVEVASGDHLVVGSGD